MRYFLFIFSITALLFFSCSSENVLYEDNFSNNLENWVVEKSSDKTQISYEDDVVDIVSPGGITLWFNKKLEGNIKIEFEALIVNQQGKYDRVSDLNCFWMSNDPQYPDDFFKRSQWRNGVFGKYYSLSMYYVGYGGNSNTTTRFRRYTGDYDSFLKEKQRPDIIKEYTDPQYLILANHWYHIEIISEGNCTKYKIDNKVLFELNDSIPYKSGYFGLRTVKNHIKYRNFRVKRM